MPESRLTCSVSLVFCGVWGFDQGDQKSEKYKSEGARPIFGEYEVVAAIRRKGCGRFEELKFRICDLECKVR